MVKTAIETVETEKKPESVKETKALAKIIDDKPVSETEESSSHSLVKKLAEIMSEVGYIPKNGHNNFQNYDYATESDVQDAVRDKLAARSVIMFPNITNTNIRETKTRKGNIEYIATVTIEYTIEDGDSGETRVFKISGEGQDSGDKAVYKAISGTQKYAIMKLFMLPTGDDPEQDATQPPAQQNTQSKQYNQTPQQNTVSHANKQQANQITQLATKYCRKVNLMDNKSFIDVKNMAFKSGGFNDLNHATSIQADRAIKYLQELISTSTPVQGANNEPPVPAFDADGNPV